MKISRLNLSRFTVFKEASFDFSPGLNVIIGSNATGKTHLMKLLHCILSGMHFWELGEAGSSNPSPLNDSRFIANKLAGAFRPDEDSIGRLVHRTGAPSHASVELNDSQGGLMNFLLTTESAIERFQNTLSVGAGSVFIPSREAFTLFEQFGRSNHWNKLWFDETYYDLCKALSHEAPKGKRQDAAKALVEPLERDVLNGKVHLQNGRFCVYRKGKGVIEAHLLAEGWRKIASLVRLIVNGSLARNGFLFWDEPEANLNPKLIRIVADMLRRLASSGIQVFVASHDYLLTHELSLAAEYPEQQPKDLKCETKFIALSHTSTGVVPQSGKILADLSENPILDEFAAFYDRRCAMFDTQARTPKT